MDRFPQTNNQNRDERTNKQREQISQKHIFARIRMISHRESDLDETEFRNSIMVQYEKVLKYAAQVCFSGP